MEQSLVSVIIPVYNTDRYLRKCIDSLLNQTYSNFQAIFVNDGSTDDSKNIIESYLADPRIILVNQENKGYSQARNAALPYIKGDYVMLLDSDDFISRDYIYESVKSIEETNADAAVNILNFYFSDDNIIEYRIPNANSGVISGTETVIRMIDWEIHSWILWKTNVFEGIRFLTTGDFMDEVTTRILASRCKSVTFSTGKYFYRQNPESVSKKVSSKLFSLSRSNLEVKQLLIRLGIYDLASERMERKLANTLRFLETYYLNHRSQLTIRERKKAKLSIYRLYKGINKTVLKNEVRSRGIKHRIMNLIKMNSFLSFKLISWIMFYCLNQRNA